MFIQIVIDDEHGPIGPGGTRALMTAIMGSGQGMKGGPYKLLKFIRIWRSNICDDGAAAIVIFIQFLKFLNFSIQAEVLRLGGVDVQIQYLELLDNNIGPRGGLALGTALSRRHNLSLLTLKLDYNTTLGSEGKCDFKIAPFRCCNLSTVQQGSSNFAKGFELIVPLSKFT